MALAFAPHIEVLALDGSGVAAIGEHGTHVYGGPVFAQLRGLVDGSRDEPEILAACQEAEREDVAKAISELKRAGFLLDVAWPGAGADAAWWASQRVAPGVVSERLGRASLRVKALSGVEAEPMTAALGDARLDVRPDAELTIVLAPHYLDGELAAINDDALRDGRPWLLAQPEAARILVGPVFSPDRGPCWECLAQRLRLHRGIEAGLRRISGRTGEPPGLDAPAPASTRGLGPALIATEVTRWLAGTRPGFESMILSFDVRSWESGVHQVAWRPQCPACGAGGADGPSLERGAAPIQLRPKRPEGHDGGLRSKSPIDTLRRFERHVSPLSGAVQMLRKLPGPEPLHVYLSGGPVAHLHGDSRGWEGFSGTYSGGKGTSDTDARASALCEALERYSGGFEGDEPRRLAAFTELGEEAIHPNEYMRFSETQYDERERWNERARSFRTYVPERFDEREPIDWSPVWSLTQDRERWFPTALGYYSAEVPGQRSCVGESNGNAAGNTLEEAILHGMLELIERDHVALWWYNRLAAPQVDLDSLDVPWLAQLRAHIAAGGRQMWAVDLTADLGIPVAAALVAAPDGSGVGMGLGAHLDLQSAVVRAATELAQIGLGAPSGGLGSGADEELHLDRQQFLRPGPSAPSHSIRPEDSFTGDVISALDRCRTAIEGQGIEVLVLDQTRPDIGLPVVKVIAPGLRHFWPRFGPGRLYDVPVALGRLERPCAEQDLNPIPPTR